MQGVFENIINKLEKRAKECDFEGNRFAERKYWEDYCAEKNKMQGLNEAIEIVKQEAEKFGTDTNVGSNGWFPCSERLPEDKQTCLVTARIYFTPDHVDEIDNYIGVGIDTYSKQFGWLGTEPIAWQPLPAPYQPKGE